VKNNIRIPLLFICFGLTAFFGWRMWQLDQVRELWGHLPLGLFLFGWLGLMIALLPRLSSSPHRWQNLGLATLSGVLLAAGFPPSPLTPLMFVGFVPLLLIEHRISQQEGNKKGRTFFKYAYHTLILWNILTTFWVANSALVAGLVAIVVNSLLMAIPLLLYQRTKKVIPRFAMASLVSYWILFEYFHLRWELTWPWLTLGNSFAQYPSWVQWYEYTGHLGGSLWILLANWLLFRWIKGPLLEGSNWNHRRLLTSVLWILAPLTISVVWYLNFEEPEHPGGPIEIAIVQPNYEPHYEKFDVSEKVQLQHFLNLSDSIVRPETQYLLYPETVFGLIQDKSLGKEPYTRAMKSFVDSSKQLTLISGLSVYHVFEPDEPHSANVRVQERRNRPPMYWESYNAAVQIDKGMEEIPLYKKSKLVPGAESFPFKDVLFFMEPLVDQLGGSTAGLATQATRSVFQNQSGFRVGPVICYESIFGAYYTGYVREGAQLLFIMTNDGWWDNTAGHKQHLRFASLRAIETRRSIARAANTGISAFINQRGDIVQQTRYDESATLRHALMPSDCITFYVYWGDMIGRICGFLAAILLLNTLVRPITRKEETPA
jgi:apolipoprotein N-acyltransferase